MTQTTEPNVSPDVHKLGRLIQDIRVAMLTTACPDGSLRSRPLVTQDRPFDGTLWFFTREHAPKVYEVQHREQVNLSYANPKVERYVSISGTAHLLRDRQKMEELWSPMLRAWFPQGKDDPELALLRVDVEKAEYWDAPSGTLVHLVGFARAALTGKPYAPDENRKLDLHGQGVVR